MLYNVYVLTNTTTTIKDNEYDDKRGILRQ